MAFNIFEGGATIVIAIILCDIGKAYMKQHRKKAVSSISGICDGIAGFGSILGQLLNGPVDKTGGLAASFLMYSMASICACLPTIPYTIYEIKKYCKPRNSYREL